MLIKALRIMLGTSLIILGAHSVWWVATPVILLGCLFLIDVALSIYWHH